MQEPASVPPATDRARGERFFRSNRARRGSVLDWLGWIALAIGGLAVLYVLQRLRSRKREEVSAPTVEAPTFVFRSKAYRLTIDPDGTAVWSAREGPDAQAGPTAPQARVARIVFSALEDALRDAAGRLLRNHAPWFDEQPKTAPVLARELRLSTVRVPPDCRDATLHAHHAAFSGHVIEIAVAPSGRVTYVGLLG